MEATSKLTVECELSDFKVEEIAIKIKSSVDIVRGVVGSLVKKNLLWIGEWSDGFQKTFFVHLTDEGYKFVGRKEEIGYKNFKFIMGGLMMKLMELMKDYLNTHKKRKNCLIKKGLEREIGKTHIITLYQYTSEKNICYKIKIAAVDRKINKTRNCHITDKNDAFEIYAYFVKKYVEPCERISMMWEIHDSNNKTHANLTGTGD